MTGRERFLTALTNGKPDRLPCQVHSWMGRYLRTYLDGCDQYEAYERFSMDPVIYAGPRYEYSVASLARWEVETIDLGTDPGGERRWHTIFSTPGGQLTSRSAANEFTSWTTEFLIKSERDFEIWSKYIPIPEKVDWSPVIEARDRIGDAGIVRGGLFGFGQGSPWQSFCTLYDTEKAIMLAFDDPDWLHHCLEDMLEKKLAVIERGGRIEYDLVETGGGAGSSTVISPDMQRRFCLPYDRRQHEAIHDAGARVVYHLCGGVMPMLEIVAENGADGLETMTPPDMGGDCDLAEAERRVGERLFFIGGFDQNKGFEKGSPEIAAQMVRELHAACPEGGYICSPSDHFFFGPPENVQAFADATKECYYS